MGPGTVLAKNYEIIRVIGEGGMGVVYAARRLSDATVVAVKVLREEFVKDADAVTRFQREARAAATMTSRHIARILDFGVIETGQPFMAMEFLEGSDLMTEIERRGALPVEEAAWYVAQATFAMIEAHELGIIHRDLKPANLFLSYGKDGQRIVKVLDFGISKVTKHADARLTSTQMSFGTPLYMSPEQIRSTKDVDHRCDIWSLGVILYEAITGEPPFMAETPGALAVAISVEDHIPPSLRKTGIPRGIDDVVAGALKKSPKERYQSAQEFLRALEDFVPGEEYSTTHRGGQVFATMVAAPAVTAAPAPAPAPAPASRPMPSANGAAPHPLSASQAPFSRPPVNVPTAGTIPLQPLTDGQIQAEIARRSFANLGEVPAPNSLTIPAPARTTSRTAALIALGVTVLGALALGLALFAWSRADHRQAGAPDAATATVAPTGPAPGPTVTPTPSTTEQGSASAAPNASSQGVASSTKIPTQASAKPSTRPRGKTKTAGTAFLPSTP